MNELMVNQLIDIGYSKEEAEKLFLRYSEWNKIDELKEYIKLKYELIKNI